MTILLLSRYSRLGASSRLRTMQYLPALSAAGLEIQTDSLFDGTYLSRLYSGKSVAGRAAGGYFRRLALLARLRALPNVEAVWIEKEALPWVPWLLEKAVLPRGVPLVTDFDDAIFHRYDQHRSQLVRGMLGSKIDHVMAASDLVIAGNAYLAERAERAGAKRVRIVPTVVDIDNYQVAPPPHTRTPVIGWIGTPGTWQSFMAPMLPVLTSAAEAGSARLVAVGAGSAADSHPRLDIRPWSEETEVARVQEFDVGIMPLTDTPWSRGKCGYKLIQYMACGLPVVASPVGVNAEIVEDGVNGFLASTDAEWRQALARLLADADLRQRMGAAGRHKVEENYSLQLWAPRIAQALGGIARNSSS